MWRDGFLDTAALARVPASQRYCGAGDGMPGDVARKEPLPGVSVVPVQSQDLEQPRREHYVAILTIKCVAETYVAATTGMPFWQHPLSKRGNITFVRLSSVRGLSGNS